MGPPPAGAPNTAAARLRLLAHGSLRELFESLSMGAQFRFTAIAAVTVTLLALQVLVTLWDTWSARGEALAFAERKLTSMAERLEATSGGALDDLQDHPVFLEAALTLPDGAVLQYYVRGKPAVGPLPAATSLLISRPTNWLQRLASASALRPIYLERPVELSPGFTGTVSIVVDHRWIWNHAVHRLAQIPFALLIGLLIALLAADKLKAQVVDPLAELVRATRPPTAQRADRPPQPGGPRNELTELANNFETLANQLVDYERDLTALRHASEEKIVERTRELESRVRQAEIVTRSKDDFLANMSHEIRTPMNGMLGMTELLSGTDLDKRQRRFVDSMRTAAETMMQIINDILDDSKIAAGKMELVREPFDVRELAEQAGQLYAGRAESKKLEMICRIEPTVPSMVVGDALRLRQVLGNLLSNAVKYTEKGEIEIRVGLDDLRDGQCRLHFSIMDTGPGIAEHDRTGVFEAFTQLNNASRIGGTGLGLSIATRLVRLMGGEKIDLRSEMGRGSAFSFVLPFEVHAAAPMPDQVSDEFSGMRVLVVDDNATSYMLLQETLANWSVEVTVMQGAKLLGDRMHDAAVRGKPYEIVLLDHNLPDATTEDMLRTIRLDPAIATTYVVLMSALDFNATDDEVGAIAPDMCIAKPLGQQLLRGALQASRLPRRTIVAAPELRVRKATAERERDALPSLGLHVLVVDDNAINREVAVAMLEELRCNVDMAEDGRVAVAKACIQRFDVILMDCQMPVMDGYAATQAIRKDERARALAATTIVALTANVLARDRERCVNAGMNLFLAKPFKSEQLVETLWPIAQVRGKVPSSRHQPVATQPLHLPTRAAPALTATHPMIGRPVVTLALAAVPTPSPAPPPEALASVLADVNVDEMLADEPVSELAPISRLPVLDRDQVQSIRGIGKPMIFERLCEMLFTSAKATFERLDAALAEGNLEEVGAAAHALKSPVSNLGGRRLADLLERCETAALEGRDIAVVQRAATGLKAHYAALVAALEAETRRGTGT